MPYPDEDLLITFPFSLREQTTATPHYRWENDARGKDPFVIIQRTNSGSGIFEFEGKKWALPEGHAFIAIVPESSVYYYPREAVAPWSFSWLNFYGNLGISLMRDFRRRHGPVLPLPGRSVAGELFLKLISNEPRSDRYAVSADCYRFLMEWASELSRPSQQKGDPVRLALAICSQRYRDPLGVKELASATGLTREHFSRLFTEKVGVSPARHLRTLRLEAALRLLKIKGITFQEAALRSGFPSPRSLRQALQEHASKEPPQAFGKAATSFSQSDSSV